MKKVIILATAAIAVGAAAPAVAADLPARTYTKAPAMVPSPIYDWSGFYIGINGGGATSRNCWDLLGGSPEGCHDATGGTVGGQIGYRWQMSSWVFGVEAQGNWADLQGDNLSLDPGSVGNQNRTRIDAFGLFTGQIGYAWNNALIYVKGGAAVTDNQYDVFFPAGGALIDSASETRWGAAVGVGVEYAFAPNWSLGFEYNHLFMGGNDVIFASTAADHINQDVDIFLARVNYKFGGPMSARY
ncbi:outer membrane protein [Bradyrhizobium sp.]|uniref:outer membrane protein n=1 Tax=Bradyrhizobium sp. TaxID=376 RepID=UPI003C3AA1F8